MDASGRPSSAPLARLGALVRNRPALVAAVAAAALTLFAVTAGSPQFETNDDVAMNLIAAGVAIADRPDEHLIHSNVLIGLPLAWLYTHAPRVPWFGFYPVAVLTASAASLA